MNPANANEIKKSGPADLSARMNSTTKTSNDPGQQRRLAMKKNDEAYEKVFACRRNRGIAVDRAESETLKEIGELITRSTANVNVNEEGNPCVPMNFVTRGSVTNEKE